MTITWRTDGSSGQSAAACVDRITMAMRYTTKSSCGPGLLLRWTLPAGETTRMSACVDRESRRMRYSPAGWCDRNSTRLSWVRTLKRQATTTTVAATTSTTTSSTTTSTTTTTTSSTTTTTVAPALTYTGLQWGSDTDDGTNAARFDSAGNMYVAGYTYGSVSTQAVVGSGAGTLAVYISKFSPLNVRMWTRMMRIGSFDSSADVAVTPSGDSYVVWQYTPDGGTDAAGDGQNLSLAKFDTSGNLVWVDQLGTNGVEMGPKIVIDGSENMYVTCYSSGDFGAPSDPPAAHFDPVVVKVHRAGGALVKDWTRRFGSNDMDYVTSVGLTSGGSVVIAGFTQGVMPGSGAAAPAAVSAPWVSLLNTSGVVQWTKQWTRAKTSYINGLAIDSAGDIYVGGTSWSDMRDNSDSTNLLKSDGWLRKIDLTGSVYWTRTWGTSYDDELIGVATDDTGNVYVSGWTDGGVTGYAGPWKVHPWAAKFDTLFGKMAWATPYDPVSTNDVWGYGPVVDPQGGIVLVGDSIGDVGAANADNTNSTSDALYWRIGTDGVWGPRHS